MDSTAVPEASHAIAARGLGLPITYLSIRPHEDDSGRVKFDTATEGFAKLDDFAWAIIKVAGEVGARMAEGATSTDALFNWFNEGGDAEDARSFIARVGVDELGNRRLATLKAYGLLRTLWDQVEAVAAKLERSTTLLGVELEEICKRIELRKQGWNDSEIRAGSRKLSKAQAWAEIAKRSPRGAMKVAAWKRAATEDKPIPERR
jgi:hypothetical protein